MLLDNIHKRKIIFKKDDFILLKFSFSGDLYKDELLLVKNVIIEVTYGITGQIDTMMKTKENIPVIDNGKFIRYKIIGSDSYYTYELYDSIFYSCKNHNPFTPCFYYIYAGSIESNIVITKKRINNIDIVVCDCICGTIPVYQDNIVIDWRDINISQNSNFWNNQEFIKIFKNILGASLQYKITNKVNVINEIDLYDKLEYALCFVTGHDFGISICKYINLSTNEIEMYVIRDRKSTCNSYHAIFADNIKKIKYLIENCNFFDRLKKDYYKETIYGLAKIHSESEVQIRWAILIITFERFLKNILIENGILESEINEKNLLIKLRIYNKITRNIPKKYFSDELIINYRNPLIHSGELYEADIDKLLAFFNIYLDLLYSLLLNSMGYNDDLILSSKNYNWGKILV